MRLAASELSGVDGGVRDALRPASFPAAPQAGAAAHGLAALVVVTAGCAARVHCYWADDPQVDPRYRNAALWQVAEVVLAAYVLPV